MSTYRRVDYKIKSGNLINTSNLYDCWVVSYSIALQDLLKTNKLLINELDRDGVSSDSFFYHKLVLGFLNEAWGIVKSSLKSDISLRIKKVKSFEDTYKSIIDLLNENEYVNMRKFLNDSRNCIFHYKKGNYKKIFNKAIKNLDGQHVLTFSFSPSKNMFSDLQGAEDIQINMIFNMIDTDDDEKIKQLIARTATLAAQIINLLQTVVIDFLISVPASKRVLIKYK